MQNIYYPEIDQNSLIMKQTFYDFILAPKKYHLYMFLKIKNVLKESQNSMKMKYVLSIHCPEEQIFEMQSSIGIR